MGEKLISLDYALETLAAGVTSDDVKKTFEQGEWFGIHAPDEVPERSSIDLRDAERLLGYAIHFASTRYNRDSKHCPKKDIASFATLIVYFATGIYSGFGTELYNKELRARKMVAVYATAMKEFLIAHTEIAHTEADHTNIIIKFLTYYYFISQTEAVEEFFDCNWIAAIAIITLAGMQCDHQNLVVLVNDFLNKKAKPKDLREAVRKIVPKMAPQMCEPRKQTKVD